MLVQVYKRALKVGGVAMPSHLYPRVFGNDPALRKNVLRACAQAHFGAAIEAGVVLDHRVFEHLAKLGERGARIVLEFERRRGNKVTRSRAQHLVQAYREVTPPKPLVVPKPTTYRALKHKVCFLCSGSGMVSPSMPCICSY